MVSIAAELNIVVKQTAPRSREVQAARTFRGVPPVLIAARSPAYAMYQTAKAMRASIARQIKTSSANRCMASREVIAFHSSMFGLQTESLRTGS